MNTAKQNPERARPRAHSGGLNPALRRIPLSLGAAAALVVTGLPAARAQPAVIVTVRLDTNSLAVGQTTTLRVFAQVAPALRANADRIFSWYVDVLNTNGAVAAARYDSMVKAASDNEPPLASTGISEGAHRRGIRDTFLNRPGAGVSNAVELMAIPVQAAGDGVTAFHVRAGTGDPLIAEDFIVAPKDGGDAWTGGEYGQAQVALTVGTICLVSLQIEPVGGGGPGRRQQLIFTPCPGRNHTVESRLSVEGGPWQPVAGAPHNGGSVTVTNNQPRQVFRVRIE